MTDGLNGGKSLIQMVVNGQSRLIRMEYGVAAAQCGNSKDFLSKTGNNATIFYKSKQVKERKD